jgi:hypothetical protein
VTLLAKIDALSRASRPTCSATFDTVLDDEDVATAVAQFDRFSVAYQPGSGSLTHPRRRLGG